MLATKGFLVSFSDKIAYGHFLSSLSCIKHDHQAIHDPTFLTNNLKDSLYNTSHCVMSIIFLVFTKFRTLFLYEALFSDHKNSLHIN